MYRLLIVDNEEYVVDGLVELFAPDRHPELEAVGAYSAAEALNLLMTSPIDVVITDIRMPGMNGIELQRIIAARWPYCKVIFLSGYDDFAYAQEAIRQGAANYILKTEEDEVIIKAVYQAIELIRADMEKRKELTEARSQAKKAISALQREFLASLMLGDKLAYRNLGAQLEELQIPLQADKPLFVVIGKVDEWRQAHSHFDRSLMLYAVQNIADEYLSLSMGHFSFIYERSRIVWLIQSKADPWIEKVQRTGALHMAGRFVYGTFECIQSSCLDLLGLPLSFVIGSEPIEWPAFGTCAEQLGRRLYTSVKQQQLLLQDDAASRQSTEAQASYPLQPDIFKHYEHLSYCLEHRNREECLRVLELLLHAGGEADRGGQPVAAMQVAASVYSILAVYAERLGGVAARELGEGLQAGLANWRNGQWHELSGQLAAWAEAILAQFDPAGEQEENHVVQSIHAYLASNLGGDLSLKTMAMAIGHNPSYLSRLYKQKAGKPLSETINDLRLARAKELLAEPQYRIIDVSRAVGFLSEHYFYRFFKKAMGMTPQEYRDNQREGAGL